MMYGKNIVKDGFSEMVDMSEVATRIVPKSYNGYMIEGDTPWVDSPLIEKYPTIHYRTMKFEDVKMREDAQEDDEENGVTICETQKQLEEALKKKCQEQYDEGVDKPKVTIEADMELLQNTELYEDVKSLEMVSLGDTVHCNHSKLGIKSDARVIELEWDAVRNKLTFVKLGEFQYNFLNNVSSVMSRVDQSIRSDGTVIGQQIQGIINGVKAQMKAQSTVAKKQTVRAIFLKILIRSLKRLVLCVLEHWDSRSLQSAQQMEEIGSGVPSEQDRDSSQISSLPERCLLTESRAEHWSLEARITETVLQES